MNDTLQVLKEIRIEMKQRASTGLEITTDQIFALTEAIRCVKLQDTQESCAINDLKAENEALKDNLYKQCYHGNSIGWVYDQWEKDKRQLTKAWDENEELKIALNHTHAAIDVVEELEAENEELEAKNETLKKQLEKANDIIKAVRQRIVREL